MYNVLHPLRNRSIKKLRLHFLALLRVLVGVRTYRWERSTKDSIEHNLFIVVPRSFLMKRDGRRLQWSSKAAKKLRLSQAQAKKLFKKLRLGFSGITVSACSSPYSGQAVV